MCSMIDVLFSALGFVGDCHGIFGSICILSASKDPRHVVIVIELKRVDLLSVLDMGAGIAGGGWKHHDVE